MGRRDIQILGATASARRVVQAMQPPPWGVGGDRTERPLPLRADTDETYNAFVAERAKASPHYPDLAASVAALWAAFYGHVEGRGEEPPEPEPYLIPEGFAHVDLVGIAEDVSRLRDASLSVDGRVPLSVPPAERNKVRCWQDAGQICCSMRVKGPDGKARIATTCAPASAYVEEVVGYARHANVDELEALAYLPTLVQMKAGAHLLGRIAEAAPAFERERRLLAVSRPHHGRVLPGGAVEWR